MPSVSQEALVKLRAQWSEILTAEAGLALKQAQFKSDVLGHLLAAGAPGGTVCLRCGKVNEGQDCDHRKEP